MKIGYYPGCSLLGTGKEYDESLRAVAEKAGIELVEVPEWNCCGASAAHMLNRGLALALPARIIALAEQAGIEEILVPCAACYGRLITARHELLADDELRKSTAEIIGLDIKGNVKILNIIEFLEKVWAECFEGLVEQTFSYNTACYYGCLLVRPPEIVKFDDPEDPQLMDGIVKKIGGKPVDWPFKVECCGAGLSVSRTDVVARLSGRIIENAVSNGAEVIVVACPMCHSNLDLRRSAVEQLKGEKYNIPVIYLTQALGLALGIPEKKLGLHRHIVPVQLPEKQAVAAEMVEEPIGKRG